MIEPVAPTVVVLVPRRAGIPDRDRLWDFARTWWANDFPDWPIVEGHHDHGPFNRSAAINRAAREAGEWDVAVIIDADVVGDKQAIAAGVQLAAASHRMVLGYHERISLTPRGTERVLGGYRGNWRAPGLEAKVLWDACSSCVIVSRQLFDEVGGFDERFVGWGWEDVAFRIACETLGTGTMVRMAAAMFHLYHLTSHENNQRELTFAANRERAELYRAAHFDRDAVRALIAPETEPVAPVELGATLIPRILHRSVPAETSATVEGWWEHWRQLLPGWELRTHRDPLNPAEWPLTADLWSSCQNGAQLAGLIRLEALYTHGGVYVDSDVEPYRSLEPLLHAEGFAAWEDAKVVPDAVLGACPGHPAVKAMLNKARAVLVDHGDAWASGPGVATSTLPGRRDWLLLPPGSFYPYHYTEQRRRSEDHATVQPWAFGAHHWAGSWLSEDQRRRLRVR